MNAIEHFIKTIPTISAISNSNSYNIWVLIRLLEFFNAVMMKNYLILPIYWFYLSNLSIYLASKQASK